MEDNLINSAVGGVSMHPADTEYVTVKTLQQSEGHGVSSAPVTLFNDAQAEWRRRKEAGHYKEPNEDIDSVMNLVGLKNVKEMFLDINDRIEVCGSQNIPVKGQRLSAFFVGNPGTGTITVQSSISVNCL